MSVVAARADGADRSVRAAAVLGCDGASSTVRGLIGATMRDLGPADRWLVLDVRSAGRCRCGRAPTRSATRGSRRRSCRSPATGTAGSAGWRRGRPWPTYDAGAAGRLLAPVDPAAVEFVRAVEYTFRAQVADRWRAGRVLLAGDAAHLSPPFVGQGLGLGLRDVHQLAWKLADVLRGEAGDDLLDTYQAEREPHARALIRVAQLLGRLMTGGGRGGDVVRRGVLAVVRRIPAVARLATDSRTPPLGAGRWSSAAGRRAGGWPAPGAAARGARRRTALPARRRARVRVRGAGGGRRGVGSSAATTGRGPRRGPERDRLASWARGMQSRSWSAPTGSSSGLGSGG